MLRYEKQELLENAAEELASLIGILNGKLEEGASQDEPEYYDYQTCYELMVLAKDISRGSNLL